MATTPVFLPGESQGQPGGLPSMGSHRVRHDWSDLAAAVAANKCYPPLSTFSVPASELSICLSLLPGFRVKADLLRSLSWTRVTPTFLEGGKEQRGPVPLPPGAPGQGGSAPVGSPAAWRGCPSNTILPLLPLHSPGPRGTPLTPRALGAPRGSHVASP